VPQPLLLTGRERLRSGEGRIPMGIAATSPATQAIRAASHASSRLRVDEPSRLVRMGPLGEALILHDGFDLRAHGFRVAEGEIFAIEFDAAG
jgi:hypothetical protein